MEFKTRKDFDKFLKDLRKNGVKYIKYAGNDLQEVELLPEAPLPTYNRKKKLTSDNIDLTQPYSEEDALFWSSAGIPEEAN